jgi:hypothetical protein
MAEMGLWLNNLLLVEGKAQTKIAVDGQVAEKQSQV